MDYLKAGSLFDLKRSIAGKYFENLHYPWAILAMIKDIIVELSENLSGEYTEISPKIWVGEGVKIAPTAFIEGPAIIGSGTEIRHCAYLRKFVIIGENCVVGNSSELKNAILFDKASAPHLNYVGDSIMGFKAHIGAGVILSNVKSLGGNISIATDDGGKIDTGLKKFGALIGDRTEIGCNSVLSPGSIIGRDSMIYPLTMSRGFVPSGTIVKKSGVRISRTDLS